MWYAVKFIQSLRAILHLENIRESCHILRVHKQLLTYLCIEWSFVDELIIDYFINSLNLINLICACLVVLASWCLLASFYHNPIKSHTCIIMHDLTGKFIVHLCTVCFCVKLKTFPCDWLNSECRVVWKVLNDLIDFRWVLSSEKHLQCRLIFVRKTCGKRGMRTVLHHHHC